MIYITSRGIARIPFLIEFIGSEFALHRGEKNDWDAEAVAGWGMKDSSIRARNLASRLNLPYLSLEDGFLRSFGTGNYFPPLSMVVDAVGIYYDSTRPSALENLLNSGDDLLEGREENITRACQLVVAHRLSKYNHAPRLESGMIRAGDVRRVLVVDQTKGDSSVVLGSANSETFKSMLEAAHDENPTATIYVKTHPEVSSGRKNGYLTEVRDDRRTVVLRDAVNPLSLIEQMDHIYVVSSTMGFEGLVGGKSVTCFGLPWYAGWGATDDRQFNARRTRQRSVIELFSAAYVHYTRYLNPRTHKRGTIFDVIEWLKHQREMTFGAEA